MGSGNIIHYEAGFILIRGPEARGDRMMCPELPHPQRSGGIPWSGHDPVSSSAGA